MRFNLFLFIFFFSLNVFGVEKKLEMKIPAGQSVELVTAEAMLLAVKGELEGMGLDGKSFSQKITSKNLSDSEKIGFVDSLFLSKNFAILPSESMNKTSVFTYEIDQAKAKKIYDEMISNIPDVSIKTFYILPDIGIDKKMTWADVGVSKRENFSGVIVESWKKWAGLQFKNFTNVVVLDQDVTGKFENINPESVILKWNSSLKRGEVFQDRKSARFDVAAQYVLNNAKTGQSLLAFDFPAQKKEFGIFNPKELSSSLASLIYNLLNSQTIKITSALEVNKTSNAMNVVEIKITGPHGLLDITHVNAFLAEQFKSINLTSELKSYSPGASVISINSSVIPESLYANFAKDGGRFLLNEQKILVFQKEDRTFAIIPK